MKNNIIICTMLSLLLQSYVALAAYDNAQIEITAVVPKFCKFEVKSTLDQKGIDLTASGKQRLHLATIHLDCNSIAGYSITLRSDNGFKLTHSDPNHTDAVAYDLEIPDMPAIITVNATEKKITLLTPQLTNVFEVYIIYDVETLTPGNYNDSLNMLLQAD